MKKILLLLSLTWQANLFAQQVKIDSIKWDSKILVNNEPVFTDAGNVKGANGANIRRHGMYGSQYCRLLQLKDGRWIAGYTISRNNGYKNDPKGGLELQFSESKDNGRTWKPVSIISDPGRDLDNAQMIELPNGNILLSCRSVRWQESYVLPSLQKYR
ncbi:exo-alpha-sialidase [Mucilaginibacter sp. JRF]|uniref:sialidase family protein n=1 Tax=Mucilaginibacter sp. JRF TaxID=2780088 RepID=UPI001881F4A4|nr:sialidase family protein [Mucilaginibacter sp. JRF]MBE9583782.1 exo-alpha-sialidase [Mucilaginibacter sp. JRF]